MPGGWQDMQGHSWVVHHMACPSCSMPMIRIHEHASGVATVIHNAYPRNALRPIPAEVGSPYRDDFAQACEVLPISPKASAAISRRCLQMILKDQGGFTQKDLAPQIEAAIASGKLPTYLSEAIDAVRNVGNFAAHPLKSQVTGAIVDVEPGEAEWLIETVEGMFDFYLVQPALLKAKRDALDKKLAEIGKPPLK
jgi:hypothetical protein